mgnify:CR=1 FL=1
MRSTKALKEGGFIEGQMSPSSIVGRTAGTTAFRRLPTRLVRLQVFPSLLPLVADAVALAAKTATSAIPIVFGNSGDPVGAGLVVGLSRPGR